MTSSGRSRNRERCAPLLKLRRLGLLHGFECWGFHRSAEQRNRAKIPPDDHINPNESEAGDKTF